MSRFSVLLISILLLMSCGSSDVKKDTTSTKTNDTVITVRNEAIHYDTALAKGRFLDTIICKNQPGQSYALYLPPSYTSAKAFPCIFFFDAHARGLLPLKKYRQLAEKYGFVFAASNISKNGMQLEQASDVANTMMNDARARINIDPKQIYVAGFSGGARVAGNVALQNGDIDGVISCAAGISSNQPVQRAFDYFGLVGDYDFNYNEMVHSDDALGQYGFIHQLLTFKGKHEWPPLDDFETAILWMQVNAIKENRQPFNDTLFGLLNNHYNKLIKKAEKTHDIIEEERLLASLANVLTGRKEDTMYRQKLTQIQNSQAYKAALIQQQYLQQEEQNQQQMIGQEFAQHDTQWWINKIAELKNNSAKAKTIQETYMYQRLINFLGLISYLNIDHALKTNDLSNIPGYLKIFKNADPQNPDHEYLSAIYYMKDNNTQQAIVSLQNAVALGYDDISQLETETAFAPLKNNPAFQKVLNNVKRNVSQ